MRPSKQLPEDADAIATEEAREAVEAALDPLAVFVRDGEFRAEEHGNRHDIAAREWIWRCSRDSRANC